MAKCLNCLSCLKYITLFGSNYLYCSFCRKIYIYVSGPDRLKEITDSKLVMEARRISGNGI